MIGRENEVPFLRKFLHTRFTRFYQSHSPILSTKRFTAFECDSSRQSGERLLPSRVAFAGVFIRVFGDNQPENSVGWLFFCQTDGRNLSFRSEFPAFFIRVFGDTNA
ncbi:MAG: hypothetical protein LKH78_12590 [Weizmannia coagulans]|nr:hypothetical protein [Heyndrickxia coagulans]